MKKKSKVSKNHYVPVMYLRNFSQLTEKGQILIAKATSPNEIRKIFRKQGLIYAFDKKEPNLVCFSPLKIKSTCFSHDLYGEHTESYLKKLEDQFGEEIDKIVETMNNVAVGISSMEFVDISLLKLFKFITAQTMRSLVFKNSFQKDIGFVKSQTKDQYFGSIFHLLFLNQNKKPSIEFIKRWQSRFIEDNRLNGMFNKFQMTLLANYTDIPFITSDCPAIYNHIWFFPSVLPNGDTYMSMITDELATIIMPVHPRIIAIINNYANNREKIQFNQVDLYNVHVNYVKKLNQLIYNFADRFIFSSENNTEILNTLDLNQKNSYPDYCMLDKIMKKRRESS
ncbi:DUF4238 domain-containing protein [Candidatus Lokiarchaeum ossiferum]|uniref:DUF4238 domain-containing protein n=1 Tax=Candidatus Lokiarchaeum ossiferum TaxID=2951803 RepID=UPI00352FC761